MSESLTIVCQNPTCRAVRKVRNLSEQKRAKYCSRRCVGIMRMRLEPIGKEFQRLGGIASSQKRRAAAVEKLVGLSPIEIFRLAFARGWHAGVRSYRRRLMEGWAA